MRHNEQGHPTCLNCPKPARVLVPGRPPVFCSTKCRAKFTREMNAWNKRLAATELADDQPDLF